jgi:hypothetical protein
MRNRGGNTNPLVFGETRESSDSALLRVAHGASEAEGVTSMTSSALASGGAELPGANSLPRSELIGVYGKPTAVEEWSRALSP